MLIAFCKKEYKDRKSYSSGIPHYVIVLFKGGTDSKVIAQGRLVDCHGKMINKHGNNGYPFEYSP